MTAKIYFVYGSFTSEGGAKVINADGSNETLLASGGDILEPDGIEADLAGGKIYFTDMGKGGAADKSVAPDDGKIWRANLDGSGAEVIVPLGVTTTPKQLTLDVEGGKVYWCDRGDVGDQQVNPKVMRANFDGSEIETLISDDLKSPVGIALDTDNGKLYFTDRFANNIKRANLDGSDVEIVVKNSECRRAQDAKRDIPVPLSPCARRQIVCAPVRPAPGPRLRHTTPPPWPLRRMA